MAGDYQMSLICDIALRELQDIESGKVKVFEETPTLKEIAQTHYMRLGAVARALLAAQAMNEAN